MRIDFESSGGLANLQLAYHADTNALPLEQAEELLKLVNDSGVMGLQQSDLSSKAASGPADVVSYHLSLVEGNKQKNLVFTDVTAPASVRPLLALLRKLAVEQKRKAG